MRSIQLKIVPICLLAGLVYIGFACSSLVQEVSPAQLVKEAPKLVVACFISPQDTLLAAKITQNNPVLGDTTTRTTEIKNATVTLSDGIRSASLVYSPANAFYQLSARLFPISAGKTYTLTASTPDGRTVSATATVPKAVPITEVLFDFSLTTSNTDITKTYFVAFRWKDPADTTNYYRVAGTFAHAPIRSSSKASDTTTIETINFRSNQNRRSLISDEGADGNIFTTPNGLINQSLTVSQSDTAANSKLNAFRLQPLFRKIEFRGELLNTDAMYYKYHQSIEAFRDANGNPFAEPVLVPTNIQNGLGCFAAYNRTTLLLKVK